MSNAKANEVLDPLQRRAAILFFRGKNRTGIALELGVSKQTVGAWMQDDAVRVYINNLFSRMEQEAMTDRAKSEATTEARLQQLIQSDVEATALAAIQVYYKYLKPSPPAKSAPTKEAANAEGTDSSASAASPDHDSPNKQVPDSTTAKTTIPENANTPPPIKEHKEESTPTNRSAAPTAPKATNAEGAEAPPTATGREPQSPRAKRAEPVASSSGGEANDPNKRPKSDPFSLGEPDPAGEPGRQTTRVADKLE
jgi:hypothetical protein